MMPLTMGLIAFFLLTARLTQTDADLFAARPARQKHANRSAIHIIYVPSLN
jgi:hypothetical protein